MRGRLFHVLIGAVLVAFGAAGSAAPAPKPQPQPYNRPYDSKLVVGPPMDPRGAYIDWRRIGVRREGSRECPPAPPGWRQDPLFDRISGTSGQQESYLYGRQVPDTSGRQVSARDRALLRKLGLDRFCAYTAETAPPAPFQEPAGLTTAEDRMAVSISAALDRRVVPALANQFRDQTHAVSLSLRETPRVQITFIDSEPTGPISFHARPGSRHGYTVMHLARELVCSSAAGPSDRCADRLRSRRALNYYSMVPRIESPADQGGYAGTIFELASAISEEVLDWQPTRDREHLILNLSLGWDGEGLGDLKAREPSVQAVYKALRFAAQKGVLVIAAAGNRRGGSPGSRLPVLPAAWELRRPSAWPFAWCHKLVYAVGGVDGQGLPLPNARRGGFPKRVAYGDHAVVEVDGEPTGIYTGSSVSTAVVSATAAMVWHLRPNLRADQLMKLIDHAERKPLRARADFYPWRHILPPPRVQRVSLCAAVKRACGPGAGPCPRLAELPKCPDWRSTSPALKSLFPNDTPEPLTTYRPASNPPSFIPPCERSTRLLSEGGDVPSAPCPTDQFSSVTSQPWVLPQPGDDPCPGCMLFPPPTSRTLLTSGTDTPSYTLKFEIAAPRFRAGGIELSHTNLESATLDIDCFGTGGTFHRMTYPLEFYSEPGMLQTMGGFGDGRSLRDCRAQINFVVGVGEARMSVQNPVVIDPEPYSPATRAGDARSLAGVLPGPGR